MEQGIRTTQVHRSMVGSNPVRTVRVQRYIYLAHAEIFFWGTSLLGVRCSFSGIQWFVQILSGRYKWSAIYLWLTPVYFWEQASG